MKWINQNVDKVIAFAGAAILLVVAVWMGLTALQFEERPEFQEVVSALDGTAPKSREIEAMDKGVLQHAAAALGEPMMWQVREIPLFTAQSYLVQRTETGEELVKIEIGRDIHHPITTEFILKHNLPIDDVRLKDRDFDGDGFTVLEEFLAGTNPVDPESYPPLWVRLRLKEFTEIPFRLKVSSRSGETVFIETLDLPNRPTQFLRAGDQVEGTLYRVQQIIERSEKHPELGFDLDVSEVVFEHITSGNTISAKVNEIADDPASFAVLVNLMDNQTIRVELGDTFSLEREPETTYKVIDMSPQKVVIENQQNQEQWEVPPVGI